MKRRWIAQFLMRRGLKRPYKPFCAPIIERRKRYRGIEPSIFDCIGVGAET